MTAASIIAAWPIVAAIAAGGAIVACLLRSRDRRRSDEPPARGRQLRATVRPEDALHQRARHYLASGALPRWDP